jgi:hypothetical protein
MRLAHLILVHNNPKQLERLINRLSSNSSDIYIHVDNKANFSEFKYLLDIPNVFFIKKRISVKWGNYSMVNVSLIGMKEILEKKIHYSHINLLSGQDYLLKGINEIEDFFFTNPDYSYLQYYSINRKWQEAIPRLLKYNLGDLNLPFKYRFQNIINWILPNRKLPENLEPYGCSQWLTLTPESVRFVLKFLKENRKAYYFFKWTWAVDEILFQTILLNSPLKESIVNDNKRFIIFKEFEPHPETLTISHSEQLLKSGKFFARKFSNEVDSAILDFLDNSIS